MKRLLLGLAGLWMVAAVSAAAPKAVHERVQASMLVTGSLDVAVDGSVSSYVIDAPEKLPPSVRDLLNNRLPHWTFERASDGSSPAAIKASMSLRVVTGPAGNGQYALRISGAEFGGDVPGNSISYKSRKMPVYPSSAGYSGASGTVYLVLRVGRQGTVLDAAAQQVNLDFVARELELKKWRDIFAESALAAARHWTFNLPASGLQVDDDEWLARVPVTFSLAQNRFGVPVDPEYGKWQSYLPGPRQAVPWFDAEQKVSRSADALPHGKIRQSGQGLRLLTPLDGP